MKVSRGRVIGNRQQDFVGHFSPKRFVQKREGEDNQLGRKGETGFASIHIRGREGVSLALAWKDSKKKIAVPRQISAKKRLKEGRFRSTK